MSSQTESILGVLHPDWGNLVDILSVVPIPNTDSDPEELQNV